MATRSSLIAWGIAIASFGLLGYAYYLQHAEAMAPCPLCILQRYAFALVGVCALISQLPPRSAGMGRWALLAAALAALAGVGVAARHVWVLEHPGSSCGRDLVEDFVNGLAPARWWPDMFMADAPCGLPLEPVLGLQIPVWSLLWLSTLGVLSIVAARHASPRRIR